MTFSIWERAAWPFSGVFAAAFAALSTLRGKRVFHPDGRAYEGSLTMWGESLLGDGMPVETPIPAVIRFSRGVGLPEPAPDILGLAIKLPDLYGVEKDQDFLLATGGEPVPAHLLLLPRRRFFHATFSSILPYRHAEEQFLLGARATPSTAKLPDSTFADLAAAVQAGSIGFEFLIARLGGPWEAIGELKIGRQLDLVAADRVAFNPWNTSSSLQPAGPLNVLRKSAYRGSQSARRSKT